ncbi:hypothetical protein CC78DRAFT_568236 [Lojkania enalia]|uniref:Hydrophobin n=1 Tax=Lojkania enalia TaxID=147567 RepID=A0A9P4N8F5_9PLEO|nr:hypothetical protein CC78DRAFT_568236 [Didymosphaeria enalia]
MMRNVIITLLFLFAPALATPGFHFADFAAPLPDSTLLSNETIAEEGLELVKRQSSGCASGYSPCSSLGNPGLCCRSDSVCSADAVGHVACCPQGAVCTGTIVPVGDGATLTGIPTSSNNPFATTTSNPGIVTATTTTNFVQQPGTASNAQTWVSNQFYPFAVIPTTHANAAACSSAYTSCSNAAASCTSALANGVPGVTISAPNGGVTVSSIASLGLSSAGSICSSLSSVGCSGLNVQACSVYGGGSGAGRRCGDWYGMGAGVAIGIAGQILR